MTREHFGNWNLASFKHDISNVRLVLDLISQNSQISAPKLSAKSRIPKDELNTVIANLQKEGAIKIKIDDLGFQNIELVKKPVSRLVISYGE